MSTFVFCFLFFWYRDNYVIVWKFKYGEKVSMDVE